MIIEARDLTVRYARDAPPVLDRITMRVPEGCLYAIIGPNGSGKSTLLKALVGTVPHRTGEVLLSGRPKTSYSSRDIAQSVGVVPQSENVAFPIDVRSFVAMGRYPHLGALRAEGPADVRAVRAALDACDLSALSDRDIGHLSGGEFQRVRIARALAQEPTALLLDEPTASLDLAHEMAVLRLLKEAASGGRTVVLITHHIDVAARFADRLLLLDGGRAAAEGSVADVLREDLLEQVYGWTVAVRENPVTGHLTVTPLP